MAAAGDLAAAISAVPLADYGEDVLEARLADPDWTAARALRHQSVLAHFAARAAIIPLRFGTIYQERRRIEELLSERQTELCALVARLKDREEWGVDVYCDRATLMENIATLNPRLRAASEQAAAASPGQAYLLRKKVDGLRAAEAGAETRRVAAEVERALGAASDAAVRLRVLREEPGEYGEVVAKLAFLVERARFDRFRAAAEGLAREHAASGFTLGLTGPWPAYNFAAGENTEAPEETP